tara:strand:+ start:233 stop:637 length:405 start_codon:yes stop_codon:yes gene_type:complete
MSNLFINHLSNISLSNIHLIEYQDFYKIIYRNNISLLGLSFISDINVEKKTSHYFVELKNLSDITFLKKIDTYFSNKLSNYNTIIQERDGKIGVIFGENNITNTEFKNNPDKLCFNLKYINKGYYNNPIIHIIY